MVELFGTCGAIGEVAAASGVEEAGPLAQRFGPDVVSIHPGLSDATPFEAAERIFSHCPTARLLFLDDSVREIHVRAALQVGAWGYWTKHASFDRIVTAVRRVAAGHKSFCPAVRRILVATPDGLRLDPCPRCPSLGGLTRREIEVLLYLARGLTVRQCAERMQLAQSTVDNHKSRLMKKLGVHKGVELAVLAIREGLLD